MKNTFHFPRTLPVIGAALFRPRIVLFVVFLAWYLYAVVDPQLIFQARDKLFLWNLRFFTDFIGQPGSLLEWVDGLLVQLCGLGWPGAMAFAVLAWLLLVSTIGFMNAMGRADIGGTWVIPGIFIIWLYGDYHFHTSLIVGLTLAMTAANGWARLRVQQSWLRLVLFVAVSAVLYYVAGISGYSFVACCVVHETLAEKRSSLGLCLLLAGVGVKPGLTAVLAGLDLASSNFHTPGLDDYLETPPDWHRVFVYGYFPVCAVLVVFRRALSSLMEKYLPQFRKAPGRKFPGGPGKNGRPGQVADPQNTSGVLGRLRWMSGTILVLVLAAAAGFSRLDRNLKALLEIDYCAEHQLWNELLVKVGKLGLNSDYLNHDVNLALYHTGQLPYRMFSYPQEFMILFYREQVSSGAMICKPCDLLLELGRVNDAEHLALEMMEKWPTGRTLKRLALVKLIKGQPAAATVFLKALRDDLVWGRWAEGYLQRLAADPNLANDEDIRRTRWLMLAEDDLDRIGRITADGHFSYTNTPALLSDLLKQNSRNQMAFEYLMAVYLLTGNVRAVVDSFTLLDNFSYPALPPLYEEAAMIYGSKHLEEIQETPAGVFFRGRRISESTMEKCRRCTEILNRYQGPTEEAKAALARELGGSYLQYFFRNFGKQL